MTLFINIEQRYDCAKCTRFVQLLVNTDTDTLTILQYNIYKNRPVRVICRAGKRPEITVIEQFE